MHTRCLGAPRSSLSQNLGSFGIQSYPPQMSLPSLASSQVQVDWRLSSSLAVVPNFRTITHNPPFPGPCRNPAHRRVVVSLSCKAKLLVVGRILGTGGEIFEFSF